MINKDKTPLGFGKHKGQTPEEVAKIDPGYILWINQNIPGYGLSRDLVLNCDYQMQQDDCDDSLERWG